MKNIKVLTILSLLCVQSCVSASVAAMKNYFWPRAFDEDDDYFQESTQQKKLNDQATLAAESYNKASQAITDKIAILNDSEPTDERGTKIKKLQDEREGLFQIEQTRQNQELIAGNAYLAEWRKHKDYLCPISYDKALFSRTEKVAHFTSAAVMPAVFFGASLLAKNSDIRIPCALAGVACVGLHNFFYRPNYYTGRPGYNLARTATGTALVGLIAFGARALF